MEGDYRLAHRFAGKTSGEKAKGRREPGDRGTKAQMVNLLRGRARYPDHHGEQKTFQIRNEPLLLS